MQAEPTGTLWNDEGAGAGASEGRANNDALIEQYKLYVEMADRVATRRGETHVLFLTGNTAMMTLLALWWRPGVSENRWQVAVPFVALVLECAVWFQLIRSYRQLSEAKFRVIGLLEQRLPASPFWNAEWSSLGRGRKRHLYWPITRLEQFLPVLFALLYVTLFLLKDADLDVRSWYPLCVFSQSC